MKKYITILIAVSVFGSCNKFDTDINRDNNRPSTASGTQLIANAMISLSGLSSSPQAQFLAQYLAETQYPGASLYPAGGSSFYGFYQGPLMNLETAINSPDLSGTEGPISNQIAVAKILKAYYFWHITDRWGDVPYTEALKGVEDFTPAYDTQESIYNNLFQLLDEANAAFVPGNISNDIIYNGDVTKWKKLGNTIHMLMSLRLSKADANKGKSEFVKALNAGIMTANTDNLVFRHLADANNQNYWYGQVVNQGREWWALTENLVNTMKPVNDPRLPVYGSPARTSGEFVGLKYGTVDGLPNVTNYSLMGTSIFAQNATIQLVTFAQALFAQAEAAKLGWIPGDDTEAKAKYELAIRNSVIQWTGSASGADALIAQPDIQYTSATGLEQIATQRWVHLFMNGFEAWSEWRRTGYPDNLVSPDGANVPRRNSYVANEQFNNTENYQAAVQRQFSGNDNLYGRVWWDKP